MVSVVIPAFNEEKVIGNCLQALADQATNREFEVILVDNNSTDKTINIAKTFAKKLKLIITTEEKRGRGDARRKGFNEARGKIILSTDADTVVPTDWIEKLVNSLESSKSVAVSGTCRITDCSPMTNRVFNFLQPLFMKIYRLMFGHYWLSGFNFAIYKEAYEKSGGFTEGLNAQEDVDLAFKVSRVGKIQYLSTVPVVFSGRRFQDGLLKGLVPYVTTFFQFFFLKKKNMILDDVR